jgi:ABC-type branched-subunit amino acid transport system ATPase component
MEAALETGGVGVAAEEAAAPAASLSATDLSWRAGRLVILRDFDLTLRPGTVTGLIGPNGAGKSTAIDLLSGFREPASGSVQLFGQDVTRRSADQRARLGLARTFQESPTIPGLTVQEHVQLALEAGGRRRSRLQARDLLATAGLTPVAHEVAEKLPVGRRRMLDVARALGTAPRVLLLDEPFAGLEHEDEDDLTRIIEEQRAAGTAILIVEHRLALLGDVAETVLVLVEGKPLTQGPLAEVLRDDRVQRAYLRAGGSE